MGGYLTVGSECLLFELRCCCRSRKKLMQGCSRKASFGKSSLTNFRAASRCNKFIRFLESTHINAEVTVYRRKKKREGEIPQNRCRGDF